jgi:hypothetical protein
MNRLARLPGATIVLLLLLLIIAGISFVFGMDIYKAGCLFFITASAYRAYKIAWDKPDE